MGTVESCTLNSVEGVPEFCGIPVIAPVALNERSAGRDEPLLILKVYPGVPPDAASCPEYSWPTVPLGNDDVVIVTGVTLALILKEYALVPVRRVGNVESVTVNV